MSSTGNLGIISNEDLREDIIDLYSIYQAVGSGFVVNNEWVTVLDTDFVKELDVLKWDPRTSSLFKAQSLELDATDLRRNASVYIRNGAAHYWALDFANERYSTAKKQAEALLKKLETEVEVKNSR